MPWLSLIYSRHHVSLETRYGSFDDYGRIRGSRWEWGIGKGQWKRRVKKAAQVFGMEGHAYAGYFIIGSYYRLDYEGTRRGAELLYEEIR